MKVLIACEESQRVCTEFRKLGHEAYSCDVIDCSGGHPEWHIKGDCLPLLQGNCTFETVVGGQHEVGKWDLVIAHPPCTYLTNAGTRHYSLKCNTPEKVIERMWDMAKSAVFFMQCYFANADKVCVENPLGCMGKLFRRYDQIIHPYYFAESQNEESYVQKRTCLWLRGLPKLKRISGLPKPEPKYICQGEKCKGKAIGWCEGVTRDRARIRSKTFPSIAKAMAEQWGQIEGEHK